LDFTQARTIQGSLRITILVERRTVTALATWRLLEASETRLRSLNAHNDSTTATVTDSGSRHRVAILAISSPTSARIENKAATLCFDFLSRVSDARSKVKIVDVLNHSFDVSHKDVAVFLESVPLLIHRAHPPQLKLTPKRYFAYVQLNPPTFPSPTPYVITNFGNWHVVFMTWSSAARDRKCLS
jgi:hypothetical protein